MKLGYVLVALALGCSVPEKNAPPVKHDSSEVKPKPDSSHVKPHPKHKEHS